MAYGVILEAEYADGFIHREDEADKSLYREGKNVFHDILHKLPEADHGELVRFTARTGSDEYSIDWTTMPDSARPIYYREMQQTRNVATGDTVTEALSHHFGFQYTGEDGRNYKEIIDI